MGEQHDWAVTSGYDPARDGPWPEWGRVAVTCSYCGETRRIWQGLSLADPALTYGCPVTRIAAGSITCERIVAWRPAHAGDCYYAGQDHPRRTCHGAVTGPPVLPLVPGLGAADGPAPLVRPGTCVALVLALVLTVFYGACILTGAYPTMLISWGAVMADAGLICWSIVAGRR